MTNPTRNDISLIDYVEHDSMNNEYTANDMYKYCFLIGNELKKIPKQSPNLVSKVKRGKKTFSLFFFLFFFFFCY